MKSKWYVRQADNSCKYEVVREVTPWKYRNIKCCKVYERYNAGYDLQKAREFAETLNKKNKGLKNKLKRLKGRIKKYFGQRFKF